ncbi:hypothetical protein HPB52_020641 [Rhipicephalus sanguineus]|uniref:C2H2-type domain-containing protein n=1 Tax=Rhipicephalus sanguineus TaxID=34632 RepID=A0A9D4SV30_RHISA|nr:hypothetical protein HPB52_020641 [Rhipicephalus sanguineus]
MAAESAAPTRERQERCEVFSMDAKELLPERQWEQPVGGPQCDALQQFLRDVEDRDGLTVTDPDRRALSLASCWVSLRAWHQVLPFQDAARVLSVETLRYLNGPLFLKTPAILRTELLLAITKCKVQLSATSAPFLAVCEFLERTAHSRFGDPLMRRLLEYTPSLPLPEGLKSCDADELLRHLECLRFWRQDAVVERICREQLSVLARQEQEERNEERRQTGLEVVRVGVGGQAFLEHLLCVLYRQRRIQELCTETSRFSCHEGVQLVRGLTQRANDPERADVAEALAHVFLVRDLLQASPFCCTRELMVLWCQLQRIQGHAVPQVARAALRLLLPHAANSAQFYLFCDVLWEHYGRRLIPVYLDLFVRGLTTDINSLQSAMHWENWANVREMEVHMAGVLLKLATLFPDLPEVSRECVLSAFALDPTEERLAQLERLTEQVKVKSVNNGNNGGGVQTSSPQERGPGRHAIEDVGDGQACRCGGRCNDQPVEQKTSPALADGRPEYEMDFWHPILNQQLDGVPYRLLKDFVTVLECVRPRSVNLCSDWHWYLECFESRRAALRNWRTGGHSRTPPQEYCGSADSETDSASEEDESDEEARRRAQLHIKKVLDSTGMPVKRRDKRRANAKCKSSRKKKKKSSKKHKKEVGVAENATAEFGLTGLAESAGLDMAGLGTAELGLTRLGTTELDSAELGPMELCPTGLDATGLEDAGLDSTELDATGLETIGLEPMDLDPTVLAPPLQEEKAHDSLQVGMPKVKKKSQKKGSHKKKEGLVAPAPTGGGCLQTLRVVLERFDKLSGSAPNHLVNKKSGLRIVPVMSLPNISLDDESKRAYLWTDGATAPKASPSKLNLPQGPAYQRVASEFEARLQTTPLKQFLRYQIKRPKFSSKKTVPVKVSMRSVKGASMMPATPAKSVSIPKALTPMAASKAAAVTASKMAATAVSKTPTTLSAPKVVPVAVPTLKGAATLLAKTHAMASAKVSPVPVTKAQPHAIITKAQPATVSKALPVLVSRALTTVVAKAPPVMSSAPAGANLAKNSLMLPSRPLPTMVRPLKDYAKASKAAAASNVPYLVKTAGGTQSAVPVSTSASQSAVMPAAMISSSAVDLPKQAAETTIQLQLPTMSRTITSAPSPLPSHMMSLQQETSPQVQESPRPVSEPSLGTSVPNAIAEATRPSQTQVVPQVIGAPHMSQQVITSTTTTPAQQSGSNCSLQANQPLNIASSGASLITNVSTDASQVLSQLKQGQATVLRLPILNAAMLSGQEKVLNVGNQKIAINALPGLLAASTSGSTTLSTTVAGTVASSGAPSVVSAKIVPTMVSAQNMQAVHQLQQLVRLNTVPGAIAQMNAAGGTTVLSADQLGGQAGLTNITALTLPLQGGAMAIKKTWMPIRSKPGAMEYRKACNMPPVKVTKAKLLAPVSSQQQVPIVYTSPQATVSVTGATRVLAQSVCKTLPITNLSGVTHLTMPTMQMGVPMAVVTPSSVAGQITVPVTQKVVTRQVTVPLARLLQKPAPNACKPTEAAASALQQQQSVVISIAQTPQVASTAQTVLASTQNAASATPCVATTQASVPVALAEEDIQNPAVSVAVSKSQSAVVPVAKAATAVATSVVNQRTGIHLPFPEDLVDPSPSGATYVPVNSAELMPTGRNERPKEDEESVKAYYRRKKAAIAQKARLAAQPKQQPLSQSMSKSLTAICDALRCSLLVADEEKIKVDTELDYSSDDSSDCDVQDLYEEKALLRRLQHEDELNSILYVSDSVASEPDCDPYQWSSQSSLLLEQLNSDGDARDTMTPSSVGESIFEGGSSLSKKLAMKAKMATSGGPCQENGLQSPSKFTCDRCNRGFFSAYNLRRHQKNVHKMVFKSLHVPSHGSRDTPSPQQRVAVTKQPSRNTPTPQPYKTPKHSPQPPKRTLFDVAEDDENSSPEKVFCAQSIDEDQRLSFESPGLPSDSEESALYGIKDEPSDPGISSLICDNASFNVIPQTPRDYFSRKEDNPHELSLSDVVTGSAKQQAPRSLVSKQVKSHDSPELSKNLDPADILESLEVAKMSAWTSTRGPLVNRDGGPVAGSMDCDDDEVNEALEAGAGLESLLGKEAGANHGGDAQDDIDDIQPTVQHMGMTDDIKDDEEGQGSQEPWNAADQAALLEDIKAVESLGEYGTDSLDFFVAPRNVMSIQDQEGLLSFADGSPNIEDEEEAGDMSEESDGTGAAAVLANEKLAEPRLEEGDEKPCTSQCRTRSREASVKRSCPCCEDSSPRKRLTRSSSSSGGKTRSATKKVRTR